MIAIDASLALKLVLPEPESSRVEQLWDQWTESGEILIAPPIFRAEIFSVLRTQVHRGRLTHDTATRAFGFLEGLKVEIHEPIDLYRTAWSLAQQYDRPVLYDCYYLALALIARCELWTADQRLINALQPPLGWVHPIQ